MRALLVFLLFSVAFAGCVGNDAKESSVTFEPTPIVTAPDTSTPEPEPAVEPEPEPVVRPAPVRFLALGDAGEGNEGQYKLGETMYQLCELKGCDFVIYMGDNFYPAGVDSEIDPQWTEKFEKPYAKMDIPFYATLGNHDESYVFGEGLNTQKGDNEVAYHFREDKESDKWNMPARWYNFTKGEQAGPDGTPNGIPLIEFFALDTNLENVGQGDGSQSAWIQDGLENSAALWKFTFGHHLYASNSMHGQSAESHVYFFNNDLMRRWFQENTCGRADIMFGGHDHILEWLHPRSGCPGTELIISGAGNGGRALTGSEPSYYSYGDGPGVAWIEVDQDRMDLEYYHVDDLTPKFSKTLLKSEVGANEYPEDPTESPWPIPNPLLPSTSFVAYGDGGHDRTAQIRNSRAAADVCNELGCDMVLHVTGSIGHWSDYAPVPENFHWTWGQGTVEFFRVDAHGDLTSQAPWLLRALTESTATWKIVYADEPYLANGLPDAAAQNPALAALIESVVCGRADLFVSGGSHTLEWLDTPTCPGTQFVVAGASSTVDEISAAVLPNQFAYDDGVGFWWMHATRDRLEARAFDDDADELFAVSLLR